MPLPGPHPLQQVLTTSQRAARARKRVRRLTAQALLTGRHDPDALDAAILQQREAEHAAQTALAHWADWHRQAAA